MSKDTRPTSLAASIAQRYSDPDGRSAEAAATKQEAQAEARRTWGRALTADIRRDAQLLKDDPHYFDGLPKRGAAARTYLRSGLLDQTDDNQED